MPWYALHIPTALITNTSYTHIFITHIDIFYPIHPLQDTKHIHMYTYNTYTFPHTVSPCWSQARSAWTTRPCCSIAASIWPWLPAGIPGDSGVHWAYWWRSTHYWAGGVAFRDALHFGYWAMHLQKNKKSSSFSVEINLWNYHGLHIALIFQILRSEQCWKMVSWSCWYNWTSWKLTGQIC